MKCRFSFVFSSTALPPAEANVKPERDPPEQTLLGNGLMSRLNVVTGLQRLCTLGGRQVLGGLEKLPEELVRVQSEPGRVVQHDVTESDGAAGIPHSLVHVPNVF